MVRTIFSHVASLAKQVAGACRAEPGSLVFHPALAHELTRFAVGGVFLTASLLKGVSLASDYSALRVLDPTTAALAAFEFLAGAMILIRRPGGRLWAGYIALFVAFSGISGYHVWTGSPTCGCFGPVAVPPVWTLALDLALTAALIAFLPLATLSAASQRVKRTAAVVGAASLAVACVGVVSAAFGPPQRELGPGVLERGNELILTPSKWVGHPLPIVDLLDEEGEWLRSGEWEVWIVDPNCAKCVAWLTQRENTIPMTLPGPPRAVILIAPETISDAPMAMSLSSDVVLRLSGRARVECPVPTRLRCRDCVVISVTPIQERTRMPLSDMHTMQGRFSVVVIRVVRLVRLSTCSFSAPAQFSNRVKGE